jgi:eukaryotic-like serine/threonine-protein kinase
MQPGQLLHQYRIEKELAAGGFGQTFVAVDTHLPRNPQVVVKLLKPQSNDPETLKAAKRLFEQEAEILDRLGKDNPRIPTLLAHFQLKGEFYLVQEYIDGTTLTEELQGRKLSESDTIAILKEILTGLKTVHPKVIHRDLKPDNIIRRDRDRKLVLIDFGAVKEIRAATVGIPITVISHTIGIGTLGYMPREQSMGYPRPGSDIYAVGAIAIQCLTGSLPHLLFNKDTLSIEWQHLCRVNPDFATVLNKMVAPDYRQRYATASEALESIESLIPSAQIPPPTPIPRPVSPPIPTIPVVRSPPPKPIQSPVKPGVTKSSSNPATRRNFIKWLGFGGVGVVSVLALSQMGKKSSDDADPEFEPPVEESSNNPPVPSITPKLTKIQFTSVNLNDKGIVIAKPSGNAEIYTEALDNDVNLNMVKIPGGKFVMGSPESEKDRQEDESPQHQVTVPEFYLGQTLVTQAQYQAIMGNNPSNFKGNDKLPVESVSWLDAVAFCEGLSQKTNRTYRLPSEAEWEYACRAGTNTPYAFGETIKPSVVNYNGKYPYGGADKGKYRQKTTPVGSFPPNLFGLYDMHGNLWEWCLDEYTDNYNGAPDNGSANGDTISLDENKKRVLRGGAWFNYAQYCRSGNRRDYATSSARVDFFGFRVVCLAFRSS